MVTDHQVRRLFGLVKKGLTMTLAAAKAGMDPKTARRYRRLGRLPSEVSVVHTWATRADPFEAVWDEVRRQLESTPGLRAKTLFQWLQRQYPGQFADGQLRTLQRRVKRWRATAGPGREVFFAQVHEPGRLCQSDFTHMGDLGVTIAGMAFDHLVYHFVLTYSNWEACTVCFSETLESLSEGLQNALWRLGALPRSHRTDRLTAAVNRLPANHVQGDDRDEFNRRYQALLDHYGLQGEKTQPRRANENGDVEQRHYRLHDAVDQALMLRGSRAFAHRGAYEAFLQELLDQLNAGRQARLAEELFVMRPLPPRRLEACKRLRRIRVDRGSLIHVDRNVYSVHSRLIGEQVEVRLYAERLEVWYGQKKVDQLPRLRGRHKHQIHYRHVIDWLVRKPGAFEQYRYRDEMFPTSRFRMAYDALRARHGPGAARRYVKILHLAAKENEAAVDAALGWLIHQGQPFEAKTIERMIQQDQRPTPVTQVTVAPVDLSSFDFLLHEPEQTACPLQLSM